MKNKLFIIGNGFDLAHNLPTRFDPDFKNIDRRYDYLSTRYSNAYWKFYVRGKDQERNVRYLIERYSIKNFNIANIE